MNDTVIKGWSIRCSSHTYVTLMYDGKFVICLDNDTQYMELIINYVEKRTQLKFTDIPILGSIEDFDGLRFLNGGFKKGYEWLNKSQEKTAEE